MAAKPHGLFQSWFENFWCFALFSFAGIGAVHFDKPQQFLKSIQKFAVLI